VQGYPGAFTVWVQGWGDGGLETLSGAAVFPTRERAARTCALRSRGVGFPREQVMSEEFENNQVVRSEEIKAIEQATEILQSDAVSGNADKHLPSMIQLKKKGTALAPAKP